MNFEQAFPNNEKSDNGSHHHSHPGMTLRDYFAAQALLGMGTWMPNPSGMLASPATMRCRADWAYQQADAMLASRANTSGVGK